MAQHLARFEPAADDEALLPEQEFRRDAGEDRVGQEIARRQNFARGAERRDLDLRHRLEGDRGRGAGDHALAALHAARVGHRVVEVEADAGIRALAGAADDVILLHVTARADAAVAQNARAVVDLKNGRRFVKATATLQFFGGSGRRIGKDIELEAGRVGIAALRHNAELIVVIQLRRRGRGLEMIGGKQFGQRLHCAAHALAVGTLGHHGENFHAFDDLVLARGQKLSLGGALAAFHAVDLHDAQAADRDRLHVRLMAENGNRHLRLVAGFLHI